jgi:hypothetical protein
MVPTFQYSKRATFFEYWRVGDAELRNWGTMQASDVSKTGSLNVHDCGCVSDNGTGSISIALGSGSLAGGRFRMGFFSSALDSSRVRGVSSSLSGSSGS